MEIINLQQISEIINGTLSKSYNNHEVTGISIDTRTIQTGDLFFALQGKEKNGHDYLDTAIKKGAVAVVVSDDYYSDDSTIIKVANTYDAFISLATYFRNNSKAKFIAVIGNCGKTTTKDMLSCILSSTYKVHSTEKNYNNKIGVPLTILQIDSECDICIIEIGYGNIEDLAQLLNLVKPNISILTNFYPSNQELVIKKLDELENNTIITSKENNISFNNNIILINNNLWTKDIIVSDSQTTYTLMENDNKIGIVTLNTLGEHNINNSLYAFACCKLLNLTYFECISLIKSFTGTTLRCEMHIINGINLIKDYYSSTVLSCFSAFKTLKQISKGKKILILGDLDTEEQTEANIIEIIKYCNKLNFDLLIYVGNFRKIVISEYTKPIETFCSKEKAYIFLQKYISSGSLLNSDTILLKANRSDKFEEIFNELRKYLNAKRNDKLINYPMSAAKIYVDITAMKYNILQIKKVLNDEVEILPIIKANAYSIGTDIVANIYSDSKILAVADGKEAVLMKNYFPDRRIMILYQPHHLDIDSIVANDFISGVCSFDFLKKLNKLASENHKIVDVHIEIDTGSGRLGIQVKECENFITKIKRLKNINVQGLYMHYVSADSLTEDDIVFTKLQTERFNKAIEIIENIYGKIKYKHACSSAAIFNCIDAHFNMVRPGYMVYGYYPCEDLKKFVNLKPSLTLTSEIVYIKTVEKGTPISYSRTYTTDRVSKIATVSIGYADGISRMLSNKGHMVVNGQLAPIVGKVCMDLTMIDITDIVGDVNEGDEVSIFDNSNITLEKVAEQCETIGYEIIARLEDKVERIETL